MRKLGTTLKGQGTLGQSLDMRDNSMNFLRLILASMVVVSHAGLLAGANINTALESLGPMSVNVFFAMSGFLIVRSWFLNPDVRVFMWNRFLRILPAYWVCLLMTALVAAPLSYALKTGRIEGFIGASDGPLSYLAGNALLLTTQATVSGTPSGVPFTESWNLPLWTLFFEALCYLAVAALGIVGILRRKPRTIVLMFGLTATGLLARALAADSPLVDNYWMTSWIAPGLRFMTMFFAGSIFFIMKDKVPVRGWLAALATLIVVGAQAWEVTTDQPNSSYVVFAALPLAYLGLWISTAIKVRIGQETDLSYGVYIYGFVVAQVLATLGVLGLTNWIGFTVITLITTLPIAAASWHLVERRALALKKSGPWNRKSATAPSTTASPAHQPSPMLPPSGQRPHIPATGLPQTGQAMALSADVGNRD